MKRVGVEEIVNLQRKTCNIRNICVIAHIDHGKTTLTDSLVCSNGIISPKLAGKLRFMDSTEDEQQRGITMHSSAISLLFKIEEKNEQTTRNNNNNDNNYLINLIDSPGHIDFSSDVSTATRLCDGALIVIDVLEGICTQTHAVIYKALKEGLTPCLILNKIDRLSLELQLTSTEAFFHLRRILENVNALTYTLLNSELQLADNNGNQISPAASEVLQEIWNFSPSKGNVVFASAFDTWGFSITKFVNLWARDYGLNRNVLQKYMFEDYSFNRNTKKIVKYDMSDAEMKPMFASMILEPIWTVYDTCITRGLVQEGAQWFCKEFSITIPPRDINVRDPRGTVKSLMRAFLPLSEAVLRMVIRTVPNPIDAQRSKLRKLLYDPDGAIHSKAYSLWKQPQAVKFAEQIENVVSSITMCNSSKDADVVVFVSKMTPVRVSELRPEDVANLNRELKLKDPAAADLDPVSGEVLMALGRVFSGVVRRDSRLFVLSHRHDPCGDIARNIDSRDETTSVKSFTVPAFISPTCSTLQAESIGIYLCFGPSVMPVDEVPAGNIIGLIGIADYILKTGTLASTWICPTLKAMTSQAKPIVRVAVEPVNYYDLNKLERGLKMLYQYDPAVEIGTDASSGQQTMACLGEIHQEQCVKYLVEKFARCEIKVSEPIVPFKETVLQVPPHFKQTLPQPWKDMFDSAQSPSPGRFWLHSSSQTQSILFRAVPLHEDCLALFQNKSSLKVDLLEYATKKYLSSNDNIGEDAIFSNLDNLADVMFSSVLNGKNVSKMNAGEEFLKRLISVGPDDADSVNIFMLDVDFSCHIWRRDKPSSLTTADIGDAQLRFDNVQHNAIIQRIWSRMHSSFVAGFQLCCSAGPLMGEPMHGICFVVERIHVSGEAFSVAPEDIDGIDTVLDANKSAASSSYTLQTGQLISEVRDSLRLAYLSCPVRVFEPMFACTLQCDQMQLGNLYSVVSRRRGAVLDEDIIEGTSLFVLTVALPIIESFGFSPELLKQTSGSATTPLLTFSHWQLLDIDPFWRPRTVDELEEFGEGAVNVHNAARDLIEKVRRRKGLVVEEKIIESAEKQRTLNKKK